MLLMARAMLTLFVALFSSVQHILGVQQILAEQMETLASSEIRKDPNVFSILLKPILGRRGQNLSDTDM